MKTKPIAFFLIIFSTIFTTSGQVLFKLGAEKLELDFFSFISNVFIIGGFMAYALGASLLTLSLKNGDLSVIYPFVSLSFIWVSLIAWSFFAESVMLVNWLGVAFIVGGISLIGYGDRRGS